MCSSQMSGGANEGKGKMVGLKTALKITHVIFDMDGLLIDTESVFSKVNQCLMSNYGKTFSPELRALVTGMTKKAAIAHVLEYEGLSGKVSVDDYCKQYDDLAEKALPECRLLPGAIRLVRHLHAHSVPTALCTGSSKYEFGLKTRRHKELLDLIPLKVMSGDDPAIKRSKPAPDPFLATMDRFKSQPKRESDVLVFEDSANGVRAAVAAGMQVIMIPDLTYMKVPEEVKDRILFVLKSLEDFVPESVGLPPFDDEQ